MTKFGALSGYAKFSHLALLGRLPGPVGGRPPNQPCCVCACICLVEVDKHSTGILSIFRRPLAYNVWHHLYSSLSLDSQLVWVQIPLQSLGLRSKQCCADRRYAAPKRVSRRAIDPGAHAGIVVCYRYPAPRVSQQEGFESKGLGGSHGFQRHPAPRGGQQQGIEYQGGSACHGFDSVSSRAASA